jgi:hypothetical protein
MPSSGISSPVRTPVPPPRHGHPVQPRHEPHTQAGWANVAAVRGRPGQRVEEPAVVRGQLVDDADEKMLDVRPRASSVASLMRSSFSPPICRRRRTQSPASAAHPCLRVDVVLEVKVAPGARVARCGGFLGQRDDRQSAVGALRNSLQDAGHGRADTRSSGAGLMRCRWRPTATRADGRRCCAAARSARWRDDGGHRRGDQCGRCSRGRVRLQFDGRYGRPRPALASRSPARVPGSYRSGSYRSGSYRSGRAELDIVFRPTRSDRAVIGLPPEREQHR